jgi:hypothetical protein
METDFETTFAKGMMARWDFPSRKILGQEDPVQSSETKGTPIRIPK